MFLGHDLSTRSAIPAPKEVRGQSAAGCDGRGRIYFGLEPTSISGYGRQLWPLLLVALDPTGRSIDTLIRLRGREVFVSKRHSASIQMPFGLRTLVGIGSTISWALEAHSDTAWIVRGASGARVPLRDIPETPLSDAMRVDEVQAIVESFPEKRDRNIAQAVLKEARPHPRAAKLGGLLVLDDGTAWVALPATESELRVWLHVAPDGHLRGQVELPMRFRPLVARERRWVGVLDAADGSEAIVMYEIGNP